MQPSRTPPHASRGLLARIFGAGPGAPVLPPRTALIGDVVAYKVAIRRIWQLAPSSGGGARGAAHAPDYAATPPMRTFGPAVLQVCTLHARRVRERTWQWRERRKGRRWPRG